MKQYIFKRILVMIPTLFAITLIIFMILQVAPGRPGGAEGGDSESTRQGGMDGYRIYKQQFNLDKPIIINTRVFNSRFLFLSVGIQDLEVQELLKNRFNPRGGNRSKLKNYATEALQDYGNFILPHLARIIASPAEPILRDYALRIFRDNAQRALIHSYGKRLSDEQKMLNNQIEEENKLVSQFVYRESMSESEKRLLVDKVLNYYTDVSLRFEYSVWQKINIMLFDTRFAKYLTNLFNLDFGISFVDKRPVLPKIMERLQYSIALSGVSILLTYLLAVPIGIYSAVFPRTWVDQGMTVVLFMLYSLPTFFVGTVLLFLFSEGSEFQSLRFFPTSGFHSLNSHDFTLLQKVYDIVWHMFLPLVCLTYISLASLSRYARTGLLDVIHSDYIKTARAKGLNEWVVILKHAVRNGLIPILTLLGSILPTVVSGSVIIEVIFNLPGIGLEGYQAVLNRDYNMVMAIQLISAVLTLIGLLISDILYAVVDPRITYS